MSFCLYTIPMINQNNRTFIAFADTNVTVLIHWLQLGAFTHCVFLYIVFSRILIFHEPLFSYHKYKTPSTVNATIFFLSFPTSLHTVLAIAWQCHLVARLTEIFLCCDSERNIFFKAWRCTRLPK